MLLKPPARQFGNQIEGAWLLEEMRGSGDDLEPALTLEHRLGSLIELDDLSIPATDDEKGRASDSSKDLTGQIRTSAAGDDSRDIVGATGGCHQSSRGSGRGPE